MGKRNKNYYKGSHGNKKGRFEQPLQSGMKGFLITCGTKSEKSAKREAYSLLNEYADKLYGAERNDKSDCDSDEEEDIEKALQKEVQDIKANRNVARRFQALTAGANNCLFVKTTLENPVELLSNIVDNLHTTKVAQSRYLMKVFPVVMTCRTEEDKIKTTAAECLKNAFKDVTDFTYCFIVKVRNNTGFTKSKVLPIMIDAFSNLGIESTVEYNNPDYVISIDILKSVCCFSVLKDFAKYKKYNLQEITAVKDKNIETEYDAKGEINEKEVSKEDESRNIEKEVCENEVSKESESGNAIKDVAKEDESGNIEKEVSKEEESGNVEKEVSKEDESGNVEKEVSEEEESGHIEKEVTN